LWNKWPAVVKGLAVGNGFLCCGDHVQTPVSNWLCLEWGDAMGSGKTCIFCGMDMSGKRAVEHIVPQWLIDHLDVRRKEIAPALHEAETGMLVGRRQHTVSRFLAGSVCATCNNGWMSELERRTKPILIRLIADQHELAGLTDLERLTIARWTLKTAAVMNRVGPPGDPEYPEARPIPDEHLRSLHAGSVPAEVLVVGGGYTSDRPLEFMQSTSWTWPEASVPLREEDKKGSYKVGFAFRGLILGLAYYPNPEYRYGLIEGMYAPFWSGRGVRQLQQPLTKLPPLTTSPMLEGFLENIWAISSTWLEIRDNVSATRLVEIPGTPDNSRTRWP
jgi:hypothetical protein